MKHWTKLGRVYCPSGSLWWANSHSTFPVAQLAGGGEFLRIYFTSLDKDMRGRGGYIDVDVNDPTRIISDPSEPVLDLGGPGEFDESGANPFTVVEFNGRSMMFYQGWQRLQRAPFALFTGLATAGIGDTEFRRVRHTPVLDRIETERFIRGAPFAMVDGGRIRMWYVTSDRWQERDGQLYYRIAIRCAVSDDGISWETEPCTGLDPASDDEYAIGRPSVLVEDGIYRMWYSIRSFTQPYRIGYAESADGLAWTRKDEAAGIERSPEGWDSEMICYPNVIKVGSRVLMFYNGNGHGRSGIGCAELVTPAGAPTSSAR
jgi:hypothetical protein